MAVARKEVKKVRGYCAQCKSCCPTIAWVENGIFTKVLPDNDHPNANKLCPKGLAGPELVYSDQRLRFPMRRINPKGEDKPAWKRISWDEALDTIAAELNEIKTNHGAEAVAFYRSALGGSPARDYNNWVVRLAHAFGSPNTMTTTHICNWHKDVSTGYTFGTGLPDAEFDKAACILIWGHNPYNTWISHARDIEEGLKRGAKLIVVDPRRTEMAERAHLWLQVRPGTDGALVLSMIHVMISEGLFDREFVQEWTTAPFLVRDDTGDILTGKELNQGDSRTYVVWDTHSGSPKCYDPETQTFEDSEVHPAMTGAYTVTLDSGKKVGTKTAFQLLAELAARYEPEKVEPVVEVSAQNIRQAARWFATIKPGCYYPYNGLEQNTNSTQTLRALALLYALTGNHDSRGSNRLFPRPPLNPTLGSTFLQPETEKKRLGSRERPLGPAGVNLATGRSQSIRSADFYRAVLTGRPYPVKGLVAFGGNLITANPDSLKGREALAKLDFYVQVDLFMTPAAELADIVLPASSFWEGWYVRGGFQQTDKASRHIQLREAVVPPQHDSRPDMKIIFDLAVRLGLGDRFWNGDLEAAFNHELAPTGMTVADLRSKPGGVTLDLKAEEKQYRTMNPKTGRPYGFNTPSKKVEIYSQLFKDHGFDPLPIYRESLVYDTLVPSEEMKATYPFLLITSKVLEYCHGWGRALPMLRKRVPDPYVQINPTKAREIGIDEGEWVTLETPGGNRIKVKAAITDAVAPDVICTQHGWWQSCPELDLEGYDVYSSDGANANLLYSDEISDPLSGSHPLKGYPARCRIAKVQPVANVLSFPKEVRLHENSTPGKGL
jgi:anaerobic selenocysteine-containing dehydrogenase